MTQLNAYLDPGMFECILSSQPVVLARHEQSIDQLLCRRGDTVPLRTGVLHGGETLPSQTYYIWGTTAGSEVSVGVWRGFNIHYNNYVVHACIIVSWFVSFLCALFSSPFLLFLLHVQNHIHVHVHVQYIVCMPYTRNQYAQLVEYQDRTLQKAKKYHTHPNLNVQCSFHVYLLVCHIGCKPQ